MPSGPWKPEMPPTNKKQAKAEGEVRIPVDKLDLADLEAVETEPSSEVVKEHRFPFQKEFVDEITGELLLNDRTELIDNGKSVPPPDGPQVRVAFERDEFILKSEGDSQLGLELTRLVGEAIQLLDNTKLHNFLRRSKTELVFSFGANGSNFIDPGLHVLAMTYLCTAFSEIAHRKMDGVLDYVTKHGRWTFNWDDQFALTFDSWQPSGMLEKLRAQYQEVQEQGERAKAVWGKWLHDSAEPLLEALDDQLKNASLPATSRRELETLREQLRHDAYFSGVMGTADVAKGLGLDESWIRDMAREGRIGMKLSRHYVHSIDEIEHFSQIPRNVGAPGKRDDS